MRELTKYNLLIVAAGLFIIFAADHLGMFVGINSYCYSLAFRMRGPEKPSPQLAIAAIDEKTLARLGRWPLERSRYAQLLDALPEARAVGFTIIMAEPTPHDAILARSAARFGRAVFPSYIDTRHRLQLPVRELAGFPVGHIHVEQDIGGEAIGVFTTLGQGLGKSYQPAFASTITAVANGPGRAPIPAPSSLDADVVNGEIRQTTPMRINFSGPPGTFPAVSFADILAGTIPPQYFHDKIVLVGITAAGIGEGFLTPFSQNRDRMASVEVQANIINNLLNHNSIQVPGEGTRLLLCLAMSLLLFLVFTFLPEASATAVWLLAVSGFTTAVSLAFSQSQIWLPPAMFWLCATFLYVLAILFKLDKAATRLQQECSEISLHLGDAVRQGKNKAPGLIGHLSASGINRKTAILGEATRELIQRSKEKEAANSELEKKHAEVTGLKSALEHRVTELEDALARVKQLEEMLPICMYCKKIRDDEDYWERLESYFEKHAGVMFTHSICPECYQSQLQEIEETERLIQTVSWPSSSATSA
jgi:CHASE2 domain-containing sensor protein